MTGAPKREHVVVSRPKAMRDDPDKRPSEDDLVREHLGPRGVPGAPDPARMTPERRKKTPRSHGIPPEHPK
jgi:hypothetical protein